MSYIGEKSLLIIVCDTKTWDPRPGRYLKTLCALLLYFQDFKLSAVRCVINNKLRRYIHYYCNTLAVKRVEKNNDGEWKEKKI